MGTSNLTKREVIIDHGAAGGPEGLYSVGGIKFTTARLVAEKIWGMIGRKNPAMFASPATLPIQTGIVYPQGGSEARQIDLTRQLDNTACHLDDLVLRRSTIWESGLQAPLGELADSMNWDEARRRKEVAACTARLQPLALEVTPLKPPKTHKHL